MLEGQEFDIMEEKYEFAIGAGNRLRTTTSKPSGGSSGNSQATARDTVRKNGELGWIPRGIMEDYEEVLFNLEVGDS